MHTSTLENVFALWPGDVSTAFSPNKLFFCFAILLVPQALSNAPTPVMSNAFTPYEF